MKTTGQSRRGFLREGGLLVAVSVLGAGGIAKTRQSGLAQAAKGVQEISPTEDLMREHGVLKRVLMVYDELVRRLQAGKSVSPEDISDAATIIRTFIEEYHEKLEEDYLFPRFERAGQERTLVSILRTQHKRGRILTQRIEKGATAAALRDPDSRRGMIDNIHLFTRMYNVHEAREDTVLFPAFREIVSQNEFDSLGELFEKEEHHLFGAEGFERYVGKVTDLERSLGIYDLNQFTPEVQ